MKSINALFITISDSSSPLIYSKLHLCRQDGFKIVIQQHNAELVLVGIRVLLGSASTQHIPEQLKIFDRVIDTQEGTRYVLCTPLLHSFLHSLMIVCFPCSLLSYIV